MNLKELSEVLGISQTTISRALNGYPEVNKDTRKRVEEAAKIHGYAPSSIARRLAGKKVEAVGIIYPFDQSLRSSPVFLEMVRMLGKKLNSENIDVFITPGSSEDEISLYERMIVGGRCDSFVVVATRRNDKRVQWLLERNIPFVAHGRTQVDQDYAWYDVDNWGGIKLAVNALLELGHRKMCFINASEELNFAWDRKQGFLEAFAESDLDLPEPVICEGRLDGVSAFEFAQRALSSAEPPSAIICSSMMSAMGALRAVEAAGLSVPGDVSVIAWDDGVSDLEIPGLSVIEAPIGKSGERIGALMLDVLRKDGEYKPHELQQPRLVMRESVGPVATAIQA